MGASFLKHIILLVFLNICWTNSALQQNCGTALSAGRIVGGYDLGYYKYPWFASLEKNGAAWCAGTLIGPGVVVSAAHCFKKPKNVELKDLYKVKMGFYNDCGTNEIYQKIYSIKEVFVHEEYQKKQPYFDIALLILDGDTSSYQPACVTQPGSNSNTRAAEGLIQGLGDTKFNSGKYPCEIREARVLIYSDNACQNMLNKQAESEKVKNAFCAGYLEGGIDACQGDSGGPLVTLNNDHKYYLLGITSFGFECAAKDALGVYTEVSRYLNWIDSKSGLRLSENQAGNNNQSPGSVIPTSFVPDPTTNDQTITANKSDGPIRIIIELKNKKNKHNGISKNRRGHHKNYD